MEDVRRLLQENAACKVKIEGLEADLERLMRDRPPATESSEMLLDAGSYLDVPHLVPSIDGSMNFDDESEDDARGRRAAKQRSQRESVALKNVIAEKDAANADLLAQLNDTKSRLAKAEAATAASGSQIERLQRENFAMAAELERAHSLILSQKQKLRQTRAQAEELAVRLRGTATVEEENQTLKEEIEELQKKLKQMQLSGEAIQAENRRMVRTLEESSALTKRNNESFKSELEAMRAQNEKLSIALTFEKSRHSEFRAQQEQEIARYRLEVQRLQQWKANQAKTMARTVDKVLPRFATKVMNAIDRTESAIARKMDTLETQIGTLTVAAGRLSILKAPDDANDLAECDDFIAQFVGGIKSIEKLSQGYANSRPRKVKHKDEGETPGSGQSGLKMLSVNCDAE